MMATTHSQTWSGFHDHLQTPALSLICLREDMATASPSSLGGDLLSVGDMMAPTSLILASIGLQGMRFGLHLMS